MRKENYCLRASLLFLDNHLRVNRVSRCFLDQMIKYDYQHSAETWVCAVSFPPKKWQISVPQKKSYTPEPACGHFIREMRCITHLPPCSPGDSLWEDNSESWHHPETVRMKPLSHRTLSSHNELRWQYEINFFHHKEWNDIMEDILSEASRMITKPWLGWVT